MALPVSTLVRITTSIAAGGVPRLPFGRGLLITEDGAIAPGGTGKAQLFNNISDANDVLDAGDALDGATVWFSANPIPQGLWVGRWAVQDVSTTLRGAMPTVAANAAPLNAANAAFSYDGVDHTANLSAANTYAAIATAIQTTITTGTVASVTVTAGGTGYTSAPTVVFTGGGGTGAAGTATVTAQAVTVVTITNAGTGYTSAPVVTFTGGAGTGAAATAILTGVTTNLSGATFTFTNGRFLLTLASSADTGAFFGTPSIGTDISEALGMAELSSPRYQVGHSAESVTDALGEIIALTSGGPPVAIMLAADASLTAGTPTVDTREAVAAYASASDFMFGLLDTSAQALVPNDATSQSALAFSRNQGQVMAFFDNAGALPDVGGLAMLSAQNLDNVASIITPHAKAVPGVAASTINASQYDELRRKRVNVVTQVGGLSSLLGGYTSRAGYWADAQWWLFWIKNAAELAVFNAMRGSRRLTTGILTDVVTGVLEAGVRNGGIMPGGQLNAATRADLIVTTGNQEFSGTLVAGYHLWVQRATERTAVDRENRVGIFKAWLTPSEAIHNVMGDIVLSG